MYELKNYLLSMQSHWMINQPTYNAVQETLPLIAEYSQKKELRSGFLEIHSKGSAIPQFTFNLNFTIHFIYKILNNE
mgnify:CR=1 FL=1